MPRRQTAFFELSRTPSATFPQIDEAEAERRCKRARRIGLARVRIHKKKYKEVDFAFPAGIKIARFRLYCRTWLEAYAMARDWTERIRQHGANVRALTSNQLWVAAQCIELLKPIYPSPELALLDSTRDHLKRHPAAGRARTIDDVRKEVVAIKEKIGRSDRHCGGLDYKLRKLASALGNIAITGITTAALQKELDRHPHWKPATIHSTVQSWKIMLNYALDEGYLFENPADRLRLPRIIHDEPEIFTLKEVKKLMAATLFADRNPLLPECRAYLAIGMFAGIRPEEIERLEWRHVCLETGTIRVPAANAKDRARRIVEIQPNLLAWLRPLKRETGSVLTHAVAELRVVARAILDLPEWPHDVMRHTFVSYHFGFFQNESYTKQQIGHRGGDSRLFYNHYMVPVPKPEARQFWAIYPPVDVLLSGDAIWEQSNPPVRLAEVGSKCAWAKAA